MRSILVNQALAKLASWYMAPLRGVLIMEDAQGVSHSSVLMYGCHPIFFLENMEFNKVFVFSATLECMQKEGQCAVYYTAVFLKHLNHSKND